MAGILDDLNDEIHDKLESQENLQKTIDGLETKMDDIVEDVGHLKTMRRLIEGAATSVEPGVASYLEKYKVGTVRVWNVNDSYNHVFINYDQEPPTMVSYTRNDYRVSKYKWDKRWERSYVMQIVVNGSK